MPEKLDYSQTLLPSAERTCEEVAAEYNRRNPHDLLTASIVHKLMTSGIRKLRTQLRNNKVDFDHLNLKKK